MMSAEEVATAVAGELPSDERMIFCSVHGDPHTRGPAAWRPRGWRPGARLPTAPSGRSNGYLTTASFRQAEDGTWRRRTDLFASYRALMVDDIGPKLRPLPLAPSLRIETSPHNEQWLYLLREPELDRARAAALIAEVIARHADRDPGMAGVNRVFRLPGYANLKPEHDGWMVRVVEARLERRWTVDELAYGLGVTLHTGAAALRHTTALASVDLEAVAAHWNHIIRWLTAHGMLRRGAPNRGGWIDVRCPWEVEHTARAATGAAIARPSPENDYRGGFRCHHGGCAERGWRDFESWMNEQLIASITEREE